ncbi:MAG: DedA family protein [Smithellaceae bacterium]|nr:DedA family protein [Syntrophaceae bacterium]MDD4242037.1 DedA family protein [Smithellaceae bacterium]NLX52852.1 DedA family protein [Deltaproteobacteria bacterium]
MDIILYFIDFFIHLDKYLPGIIQSFGVWIYVLVFIVIFCETGLVVTPILPGDSLLFALGALAALGALHIEVLLVLLCIAGIAGDSVNYAIGHSIGPKVFSYEDSRFFKKKYLEKTHAFYEKHGGKTIIIARFMPIIRTFAPFVAGIGAMTYGKFLLYNIAGGTAWVFAFLLGGYFFGNIPSVKSNFTLVIFAIIMISVMPGFIAYVRHKFFNRSCAAQEIKG